MNVSCIGTLNNELTHCNNNNKIRLICHSPDLSHFFLLSLVFFYLQTPETEEEWEEIAAVYRCKWNFPNCVGALDGKHIRIKKNVYNYKGYHSSTMMALVSGNYEFRYLDVGGEGRQSDGGIWRQCVMKENLDKKKLSLLTGMRLFT